MKSNFKLAAMGAALAALSVVGACSSPAEKTAEVAADNMEDQADAMRDNA